MFYRALSDPTRRKVLQLLRENDLTAGELADHFTISKPTLSKHLAVLREAGLISGEKNATTITYRLNATVLEEAIMELLNLFEINSENVHVNK